jgi:hypothetical protein
MGPARRGKQGRESDLAAIAAIGKRLRPMEPKGDHGRPRLPGRARGGETMEHHWDAWSIGSWETLETIPFRPIGTGLGRLTGSRPRMGVIGTCGHLKGVADGTRIGPGTADGWDRPFSLTGDRRRGFQSFGSKSSRALPSEDPRMPWPFPFLVFHTV